MDHLLVPKSPVFTKPVVRFLGQRYHGGCFLNYRKQCGIAERSIIRPKSIEVAMKVAPFLQAWLFFGLLEVVFGDSGEDFIKIQQGENGKTEKLITTSKLDHLREKWLENILHLKREYPSEYGELVKYYRKCFFEANFILTAVGRLIVKELTVEVFTSLQMLLQYVNNNVSLIHDFMLNIQPPMNKNLDCNLSTQRMLLRGWCPALIKVLETMGDVDGLYYISNVNLIIEGNHSRCTEFTCTNDRIDKNHYTPAHIMDRCLGSRICNFEEAQHTEMMAILEAGSIPLILGEKRSHRSSKLRLIKSEKEMRYVAISHVWSQGRGNPMANSLPQCQLSYISEKVNALYPDEETIAFWIDTICCPVKPVQAQAMALERMTATYENADKVLVLDLTLERVLLPGKGTEKDTIEDCLLRILAAPWMRRMWTFQEGQLARRLCFQFFDGALDFWDANCQVSVDYFRPMIEKKIYQGRLKSDEASDSIYAMTEIHRLLLFLQENLLRLQVRPRPFLESIIWPLQFRSVSVAEDEPLCIGNLLSLDISRIVCVPAKERMTQLWTLLDERGDLRQSVLFHEGPKIDIDRFRWAPKTLLGMSGIASSGDGLVAKLSDKGLIFDSPGFVLYCHEYNMLKSFIFKTFGNYQYSSVVQPFGSFDPLDDQNRDVADIRSASTQLKGFVAILIHANSRVPKADESIMYCEENMFRNHGLSGAVVSMERVEKDVCYVRLHSTVWVTREKVLPIRMNESVGTRFDNQLHSWLAGDLTSATLQRREYEGLNGQAHTLDMCARYFEKETWCCS